MTDPSFTKGDQARLDILKAARRLFISHGYHGTSMRAIARAAGDRAVAGIYNHFPNKEAIFHALIEELNPYDELLAVLEDSLDGIDNAPDYVRTALSTTLRIMPRHIEFLQIAQIDMREFGAATISGVIKHKVFPRIFPIMARIQSLPGMKPLEQVVWMRTMASIVIGYVITEQLSPVTIFGQFSHEEWADSLADVLLYGMIDPSFPQE